MKRLLGLTLLVALIATGMSCGDNGSPGGPSGPGDLQVRLTAPIGALDSAIEFTIAGPAPPPHRSAPPFPLPPCNCSRPGRTLNRLRPGLPRRTVAA